MSIDISLALQFLQSIGNADHTMPAQPTAKREPRAKREKPVIQHSLPTIVCEKSLSAREFILAVRDSGTKWVQKDGKQIKITESTRVIFDQSAAISRYTGEYDAKLDHGGQLQRALDSANLEINPRYVPAVSLAPTAQGYTAGKPLSQDEKRLMNLTARAEKSARDLCDYARQEREARESGQALRQKLMNELAIIEQARLDNIHEDISITERRIAKAQSSE